MLYTHLKTGKLYLRLALALDCTNTRGGHEAGRRMAVYLPARLTAVYVRDSGEFGAGFRPVPVLEAAGRLTSFIRGKLDHAGRREP